MRNKRTPAIRALIFDLGKVVFDFSLDDTMVQWASGAGLSVDELKHRLVWDGSFERYERGEIDLENMYRKVSEQISVRIPRTVFESAWLNIFREEIPGIRSILDSLERRYRLVALSNTNADHARVWRRLFPEVLSHFERVFASNEIGARKPEPRSFEIVLEYLQLKPQQVVFIDDFGENIHAADELGFHTILFRNAVRLREHLLLMGIDLADTRQGEHPVLSDFCKLEGENHESYRSPDDCAAT